MKCNLENRVPVKRVSTSKPFRKKIVVKRKLKMRLTTGFYHWSKRNRLKGFGIGATPNIRSFKKKRNSIGTMLGITNIKSIRQFTHGSPASAYRLKDRLDKYADIRLFNRKIQTDIPEISENGRYQLSAYYTDVDTGVPCAVSWWHKAFYAISHINREDATLREYVKQQFGAELHCFPYRIEFDTKEELLLFVLRWA